MIIYLKNNHTLVVDDFKFKCSIGKNGITKNKREGDKKTPIGTFNLENLYFREDKITLEKINLKKIPISSKMGWCDDPKFAQKYNKLIKIHKKIHHEKLFRDDSKYDLLIPIKYNFEKPKINKGSCIFIHLTKNYNPTAGGIAKNKKDFLIMLKLIDQNTKIKIS